MNKRTVPMVIIGCVLLLAGLAGYLMPDSPEDVSPRILMENTGGRVVFTHQAHSTPGGAYGDNACLACHHELAVAPASVRSAANPGVLGCKACHGAAEKPDFVQQHQEFYRANGGEDSCVRCHHGIMKGFSSAWSHEDHKDYVGDCVTCHHEPKLETKTGRIINVKPQKCANCHGDKPNRMTDKTRKEAGHLRCEPCHSDMFESGAKGCRSCHALVPAEDILAGTKAATPDAGLDPALLTPCSSCHTNFMGSMDAYHGKCITCHEKAGRGPGGKSCQQCHTP